MHLPATITSHAKLLAGFFNDNVQLDDRGTIVDYVGKEACQMTIRISDDDRKMLNEIDKWTIWDTAGNRVFREDTPPQIIAEQKRLAQKYLPFD